MSPNIFVIKLTLNTFKANGYGLFSLLLPLSGVPENFSHWKNYFVNCPKVLQVALSLS